jgi:hypothetical protein
MQKVRRARFSRSGRRDFHNRRGAVICRGISNAAPRTAHRQALADGAFCAHLLMHQRPTYDSRSNDRFRRLTPPRDAEGFGGAFSEILSGTRSMATRELVAAVCAALGRDGLCAGDFLLADASARGGCRRLSGTHIHNLSRLRAFLLLRVPKGQQCDRRNYRVAQSHSVSALAMATCLASWFLRQFGQKRRRRYLDLDG